jgi:hypothetical protein
MSASVDIAGLVEILGKHDLLAASIAEGRGGPPLVNCPAK